jgi:gamma-D-glutamyl-L-lysine dipeptidyl-peptidase
MPSFRVRSPIAPLQAEPVVSSPQVSQRLAGQRVEVLAERGDWRRIRGEDGYEGWVHTGYLGPDAGPLAPDTLVSLGCVIEVPGGARRALPLAAMVMPGERVVQGRALAREEMRRRWPREAVAIVRSARESFPGTSYQWGGITPWGADCSGFVQTIFALHGVVLPRDASQQVNVGVAVDQAAPAAADLMFFSDREDGRITHVGIALGDDGLAHVALGRGGHAIERLGTPDDPYVAQLRGRLRAVRRVI